MLLKFKEWMLLENTIGQVLKTRYRPELIQAGIAGALKYLSTKAWTRQFPQEKLTWFARWGVFQFVHKAETNPEYHSDPRAIYPSKTDDVFANTGVGDWMRTASGGAFMRAYDEYADYLAAMFTGAFNLIRSKLNNPDYMPENLKDDSEQWHVHIASKQRSEGPEGRPVPLEGMPAGWQWVSLDKGYCDKEGKAMGHCGNAGYRDGDNIYSLRDSRNVAHLTFIVNNGVLGESKGYGNNKPSKQYHPMIIPLLMGKDSDSDSHVSPFNGQEIVGHIRGGGYKPENNFQFEDLTKEQQAMILQHKPYILDYFDFLKNKSKGDPEAVKKLIDNDFGFEFEKIDFGNGFAKVKSWDDFQNMITWLKDDTQSDLKQVPDFEDGFMDWDFNTDTKSAIDTFGYSASPENEKLMEEIIELMKGQELEDEDTEYDIEWAADNNDEVSQALRFAADDGSRIGAEGEAWKHVTGFFDKEVDDNGFEMVRMSGGNWELRIDLKNLSRLHGEMAGSGESFENIVKFDYKAPYHGYSGFDDDAYNERLSELLGEVKDGLAEKPVVQSP